MVGQDGGQPWFLFWNSQSLELMAQPNQRLDAEMKERCVQYLGQCHNSEEGGFRGAPYIASHVASSYAAVIAIVNIGTKEAYDLVDLQQMKKYLLSVKNNYKSKPEDPGFFSYMS
jgi:protein farnesyltransferase subunit beta